MQGLRTIALAISLGVGASGAWAQDEDKAGGGASAPLTAFATLDANQDKYLDLAEAAVDTRIAGRFSEADRDGDKRLSTAEYRDLIANVLQLPEPQPLGKDAGKP